MMKHLLTLFLAVCCLTAYGQSLSFDGNDDQVTLNQLVLGETFSFEMWVLFDGEEAIDSDAGKHIVSVGASNTEWASFAVGVAQCAQCAEAFITCEFDVDQQFTAGTSFPFGEWVHISVTFDSGLLKVYQQGELVLQEDLEFTEPRNDWGNAYFGARGNFWQPGDYAWNGKIARISQWTTALDQFEILHLIGQSPDVSTPGIEGLWLFDQGGGELVVDLVGDNDGSIQGATWSAQDNDAFPLHGLPDYVPTDGLVGWWPLDGNAVDVGPNQLDGQLVGSTSYEGHLGEEGGSLWFQEGAFVRASFPDLTAEQGVTYTAWVQRADSPGIGYIVGYGNSTQLGQSFCLAEGDSYGLFATAIGSSYDALSNQPLTSNEWVFVATTILNDEVVIYKDGQVVFDGTIEQPSFQSDGDMWIGVSPFNQGEAEFWEGAIDEVGVWNAHFPQKRFRACLMEYRLVLAAQMRVLVLIPLLC